MRLFVAAFVCLAALEPAIAQEAGAQTGSLGSQAALYRIFLTDGTSAVSYGEYARVGDEVIFSMPIGRLSGEPRLHLVTLPADWVDWARTTRYATSVRYRRYVETRAESDFAALSAQVTTMLSAIARTADPRRAQAIADEARQLLSEWPAAHYGYREADVREIVALIDEVMSDIDGRSGRGSVQLSLFATPAPPAIEPLLEAPAPREQIAWLVTLAHRTARPADRTAHLHAALGALEDPDSTLTADDAAAVRRSIESQLRAERTLDQRYAEMAARLVAGARRAAARADVGAVERLRAQASRQDDRLGRRRPQVVQALSAELDAQIDAARELQRRRADWRIRRPIYRNYVDSVSVHVAQLVKARGSLEAVRDGAPPEPARLRALQDQLRGGAARLDRIAAPEALRGTHEMLIGAWRFAEHAVTDGHTALVEGNGDQARMASSAAAGSLMLLAQAQEAIRTALEPPQPR